MNKLGRNESHVHGREEGPLQLEMRLGRVGGVAETNSRDLECAELKRWLRGVEKRM